MYSVFVCVFVCFVGLLVFVCSCCHEESPTNLTRGNILYNTVYGTTEYFTNTVPFLKIEFLKLTCAYPF